MLKNKMILALALFPLTLMAADPAASIDAVTAFISGKVMAVSGLVAVLLEAALRLVPSERPRSILLMVDKVLKSVAALCLKSSDFLDKVIPQNLK